MFSNRKTRKKKTSLFSLYPNRHSIYHLTTVWQDNEKQAAKYKSHLEAFHSAKHARSPQPGKTIKSCLKVVLSKSLPTLQKLNSEWRRLDTFSCSLLSWITFQMKYILRFSFSIDVLIFNLNSDHSSILQLRFCVRLW